MPQAVAGPSSSGGREAVNWDDQVVPALRRRLESESAYLSNRMSTASFPSANAFDMGQTDYQSTLKREPSARTRTKSSHTHAIGTMSQPTRSRDPPPPTPQDQAPHSAPRPSTIPMRPRSKSNLGSRPGPPTPPSEDVPDLPTGLGRPLDRPIPMARAGSGTGSGSGSGRESHDLMRIDPNLSNKDLKSELPPFRLRKGEAMRIAEKGHDLRDKEDEVFEDEREYDDNHTDENMDIAGPKRRRRQTMRSESKNSVKLEDAPPLPIYLSATSGLPRSATGNVGLGLPSNRTKALQMNPAPRSSSSRQALNQLSTSTTTPRSASLNMLAQSGSRLGIAAHLVPPESTYTPPKGQSWDEVVLPTVAKKLGLADSPSQQGRMEDDGDLAVEWDKSGTPIKWIKKETVSRLGGPGEASKAMKDRSLPGDDFITRQGTPSHLHPLNSSTKSAFSPTFEPSPDNPLYPRHLQQRPSHSSLAPSPSPTPHRQHSKEHLQAHPIRTSSGQWTSLGRPSPPPSPAPFSQTRPNPGSGATPVRSHDNSQYDQSSPRRNGHSQQPSGNPRPSNVGDTYFTSPRPMHNTAGGGGVYDGSRAPSGPQYASPQSDGRQMDQSAWSPATLPGRAAGKKEKDGHGKGCGCLIM